MPFVPIEPCEQVPEWEKACTDPEHDPPNMMVINEPMKWRCPTCGREVLVRPPLKGTL